jgi:hypothetical protein
MQEFFIIHGSLNPVLEMELIDDGRYQFNKSYFTEALQDSTVKFSMINEETGLLQVAKADAEIVEANSGCEEKYILRYNWKPRDVAKPGFYKGWFEITFNGNITQSGVEYPTGNLKVPIEEDLRIVIK